MMNNGSVIPVRIPKTNHLTWLGGNDARNFNNSIRIIHLLFLNDRDGHAIHTVTGMGGELIYNIKYPFLLIKMPEYMFSFVKGN